VPVPDAAQPESTDAGTDSCSVTDEPCTVPNGNSGSEPCSAGRRSEYAQDSQTYADTGIGSLTLLEHLRAAIDMITALLFKPSPIKNV